jgi:hypothetical protein
VLFGRIRQFEASRMGPPEPGRLPGAMLVRRGALDRVGPFATQWRVGELMEWTFRAREAGVQELLTPDVVLYRRLHDSNLSRDEESRVDHIRVLRRELVRRRTRVGD